MTRLLSTATEPVASLSVYHRNPRRGNVKVIAESLETNGQYRPLVVNKGGLTGREREVLAGNHTLLAARELGWESIAVCWLDVDDDQAARIVAADNRTSDLADYDDAMLVELLKELEGPEGTGYTPEDIDDLAAALEEQNARDGNDGDIPDFSNPANNGERPREEHDQAFTGKSMTQYAEGYADRGERAMVLTFRMPEFEWAMQRLEELGAKYGVNTNTEVVMHMISDVTGDELP